MADIRWYDREVRAQVNRRVTTACEAAAAYMVGEVRQEITAQNLIDTGNLVNSIADEMTAPDRAKVGTDVFYAIYLEFGTRYMAAKAFMRRAMETGLVTVRRLVVAIMKGGG